MQDNDRPLYSRKHVELLVKLAFIKGQEEEEATIHYIDEKNCFPFCSIRVNLTTNIM